MNKPSKSLIERLLANVEKHDGGCWLWTRSTAKGYGTIRIGGNERKMVRVHRVSYEHFVGPIPNGLFVCHKCDVRHCVNPDHLFVGTNSDNVQDCVKKGRLITPNLRGEAHGSAKLTEDDIRAIRILAQSDKTQKSIAIHFGVSRGLIWHILNGKRWGHVV